MSENGNSEENQDTSKEIDMLKVQIYTDRCHTFYGIMVSFIIALFIGVSVLLYTLLYQGIFSPELWGGGMIIICVFTFASLFSVILTYRKDFKAKTENMGFKGKKKSKRIYLNKRKTDDMTDRLHGYFRREVNVPRIKRGEKQEVETLINEEAMLLAKFLRDERKEWTPRIAIP